MKKSSPLFFPLSLLLFSTLLPVLYSGCSLFFSNTLELWTNRPEIAAYVESFNSEQKEYRIEIVYKEFPAQSLLQEEEVPDIIMSAGLTSNPVMENMKPLDRLFKKELLDRSAFYSIFLEHGKKEEEQLLLPVSFTLPIIVFNENSLPEQPEKLTLSLQDMREPCKAFGDRETDSPQRIGFAAHWEPEFLYTFTYQEGADFRETMGGELAWNSLRLEESIQKLQKWSDEVNGGVSREKYFTERNLSNPGYKLLNTEKILFYSMDMKSFIEIPEEKRETLDYRWFARDDEITVSENMLYLGVPQRKMNRQAIDAFIQWFYTPENQKLLLERARFKRLRSFGFAGGFSSLIEVNERDLPVFYPELLGKIPPEKYLNIPSPLPVEWERLKNEVLLSYLEEMCLGIPGDPLDKRLQNWYVKLQSSR